MIFIGDGLPDNKTDEDNEGDSNYQMTIGGLVSDLKSFHDNTLVVIQLPNGIITTPLSISSWRGEYRRPSLCYFGNNIIFSRKEQPLSRTTVPIGTVGRLLSDIKYGLTQTHHGWKGGEFEFNEQMVLLISNECNSDCVIVNKIAFDKELESVVIFIKETFFHDLIG